MDKIFGYEKSKYCDYENGFYLTSDARRIPKIIAHYELYKSIVGLTGHVVEFGVYKGASFIRWCNFRNVLESEASRKIIGFDAFGKFPAQSDRDDSRFIEGFEKSGGEGIPVPELQKSLESKGFGNTELVAGDISKTLPKYLEENPELRFSLIHIDVDVYEPTRVILNSIYDRLVPGGLVVLDDYGIISGETRAVDEFIQSRDLDGLIEKLPISHTPSFIRKDRRNMLWAGV